MVILHDVSDVKAAQHRLSNMAAGGGIALLAALFGLLWVLLRGTDRGIRAQQADLRASEERLSATLLSIGDGVVATDSSARVADLNQASERLTGWTAAEARGLPVEEVFRIVHAETRATMDNPVRRALAEGTVVELANHAVLIARDGAEYQIADSCAPIRGVDGDIIGAVLVFRDVTEQYRRREQLRESEHLQRMLLDSIDAGIVVLDPRTHIVEQVNPYAARLVGVPADQLSGQECHRFLCSADAGLCPVTDCGLEVSSSECSILRVDGSRAPILKTVRRIQVRGREKLLETFVDITRNKQAEDALKESEEHLRAIMNAVQDAILVMDPDGAISYWNPAAESILGYRSGEAIGQNLHRLLAPERYHRAYHAAFAEFVRTGRGPAISKTTELVARRKDGKEISIGLSVAAVSVRGRWNAVGILRDITERKQAEELVQRQVAELEAARRVQERNAAELALMVEELELQKERAEAATRAKSEFLANMSHEIRTPMNGVIGMTELLLDTGLTGDQRRYAEIVRSSGESLLGIINDILDFSKIEARKLDLETLDFDLDSLLDDLAASLALRAHEKGLELLCNCDPEVPTKLRGRSGPPAPDSHQSGGQRHQVHARGRSGRARPPGGGNGDRVPAPLLRTRHGHRHRQGQAQPAFREVQPGGRLDHPQLRRHRAGSGHLQATGRDDGRRSRGGERGGQRLGVLVHARPWPSRAETAQTEGRAACRSARRARSCRR